MKCDDASKIRSKRAINLLEQINRTKIALISPEAVDLPAYCHLDL